MLDEEQREELIARLESVGETSAEEPSESNQSNADDAYEQVEDRETAGSVAAEDESTDVDSTTSNEGRQSGAQRRISDLVRQRNDATESFRELQERFSTLEGNMQNMQKPQHQEPEAEQDQYYDEHGNLASLSKNDPDVANLRAEFDQYREAQVIEQVKGELEQELQGAIAAHPDVDGSWLRSQLIDAVRLNGNANIDEMAEYYSAFVTEVQQKAVSQHQSASVRQPAVAPPRMQSRGASSSDQSRQTDNPFTRDDARARAYKIIGGR